VALLQPLTLPLPRRLPMATMTTMMQVQVQQQQLPQPVQPQQQVLPQRAQLQQVLPLSSTTLGPLGYPLPKQIIFLGCPRYRHFESLLLL
jgi:hypothetical protein